MNANAISVLGKYNGCRIRVKPDATDYISATDMAKACGKEWKNYNQNQTTQEFLRELSRSAGIPTDLLVVGVATGPNDQRGTWVHRHVAIHFAQWLSPQFSVWCIQRIDELLQTGRVIVHPEHSEAIVVKAIGEIGTAITGIHKLLDRHSGEVEVIRSDINDVKVRQQRIESDVSFLKAKADGERKNFGKGTHECFALVIVERFAGKCPVCESVSIAQEPWNTLPAWELHHWRMKGGSDPRLAFPCCSGCHARFTSNYMLHDIHENLFSLIQKWASAGLASRRAVTVSRVQRHDQLYLFDSTLSDILD